MSKPLLLTLLLILILLSDISRAQKYELMQIEYNNFPDAGIAEPSAGTSEESLKVNTLSLNLRSLLNQLLRL